MKKIQYIKKILYMFFNYLLEEEEYEEDLRRNFSFKYSFTMYNKKSKSV